MLKQAIIFRRDLKLSVGKMIVQGAHAAVGAATAAPFGNTFKWFKDGATKIVLTVATEADLWALRDKASKMFTLPVYLVSDAGRTEVEPGTVTCLAIGPGEIDSLIGSLPLLRDADLTVKEDPIGEG